MCRIVESMFYEEHLYPRNRPHPSNISSITNGFDDQIIPSYQEETSFCAPFWDTLSCLPATEEKSLQVIPCPPEIQTEVHGQIYKTMLDTTSNIIPFNIILNHKGQPRFVSLVFCVIL